MKVFASNNILRFVTLKKNTYIVIIQHTLILIEPWPQFLKYQMSAYAIIIQRKLHVYDTKRTNENCFSKKLIKQHNDGQKNKRIVLFLFFFNPRTLKICIQIKQNDTIYSVICRQFDENAKVNKKYNVKFDPDSPDYN